jgi:mannose-6-phosphate isomerase-like protein (cupin superfamily)
MQLKVTSEQGERADFPRLATRYLIAGEHTGGRFALIEHTIPPRALAAPVHVHEHEDEYSFVLQGRMGARVGDEEIEAGPGDLVVKPRAVPHAFWNPGDEETRLLELISPAGFERYFADMAPLLTAEGEPDFAARAEVQSRYRLEMDLTTIEPLMRRHGLEA